MPKETISGTDKPFRPADDLTQGGPAADVINASGGDSLSGSDTVAGGVMGDDGAPFVPAGEPLTTFLTQDFSEAYGPKGTFKDLTEAEAATAPEGLLAIATPEQLARRRG